MEVMEAGRVMQVEAGKKRGVHAQQATSSSQQQQRGRRCSTLQAAAHVQLPSVRLHQLKALHGGRPLPLALAPALPLLLADACAPRQRRQHASADSAPSVTSNTTPPYSAPPEKHPSQPVPFTRTAPGEAAAIAATSASLGSSTEPSLSYSRMDTWHAVRHRGWRRFVSGAL